MPKKNVPVHTIKDRLKYVYGKTSSKPTLQSLRKWLMLLLGAKFQLRRTKDDFALEHFVGPFVVSFDVVNGWLLFINHKKQEYIYVADLNRIASIIEIFLNGDIERAISWLLAACPEPVNGIEQFFGDDTINFAFDFKRAIRPDRKDSIWSQHTFDFLKESLLVKPMYCCCHSN